MTDWHKRLAAAQGELKKAREDRDAVVLAATEAGLTRREIGEVLGVSHGRVQQLVARAREGKKP